MNIHKLPLDLFYIVKSKALTLNDKDVSIENFINIDSKLISNIIQICKFKIIDKKSRNLKINLLYKIYTNHILTFESINTSQPTYIKELTDKKNYLVLNRIFYDMNKYLTPYKIRKYLLVLLNQFNFNNIAVYNRLQLLYHELNFDVMPMNDYPEYLLKNYVMTDIIGNINFKDNSTEFYIIIKFIQYINNNIEKINEIYIEKIIKDIITNNMNLLCTDILTELRTLMN